MAAASAAARAFLRRSPSPSLCGAAARVAGGAKASRPPLHRLPKQNLVAPRFLRSPVELSCCVESLMPMHSATAAALMTSMLVVSRRGGGWLSEAANDDA
ncbi:protein NUCLEAR FUSION DEFECTIVE 6, mitochondrial-like isoform X1 [Typha latifolia]|uniref:protein NUCLEAR FUSION DEFECTIVE 6, mitochondrial-like isoform X1 n=1 Tax=Typha latifolia TaxID=4733 RepID=UPI003C2F6396